MTLFSRGRGRWRFEPVAMYALLGLNALVFAAELVVNLLYARRLGLAGLDAGVLYLMGAKFNPAIVNGQYWRLVTPIFLHASGEHLLFNLFALYVWGRLVEQLLGHWRFLLVYLAAGILGCCLSFAFSNSLSVGASGAIFGLFGAMLCFRSRYKEIFNRIFGMQVIVLIVLNLALGFFGSNIDYWGHVGGLIGGYLAGFAVGFQGEKGPSKHLKWALPALLLAIGGVLWIGMVRWG